MSTVYRYADGSEGLTPPPQSVCYDHDWVTIGAPFLFLSELGFVECATCGLRGFRRSYLEASS
ncbi:hypothetical protein [Nakamurella lactea]|uniref:hypothetical protein n=1 Tax=Nakamurella lactea TaxID=459515 RepID=UPI00041D29B8|nr:hypothetical protein [Nakamurella lactea]